MFTTASRRMQSLFRTRILAASAALGLTILAAGCSHPTYVAPPPPGAFASVQQQGFAEGAAAARRDIRLGRPPVVQDHPRFRRPPVGPPFIDAYRQGFEQGYSATMHTPPPGPGM